MKEQLQDYILLKAISDKFNMVADTISESDIKDLIVRTIERKVDEAIGELYCFHKVEEVSENWIDKNSFSIENMVREAIKKKLE